MLIGALSIGASASAGPLSGPRVSGAIHGSWDATVDFNGLPLRALLAFHQGGTLTEADNPGFDPAFGGNALSPGLGSWKRRGRRFVGRYRKLAYSPSGQLQQTYTSSLELFVLRNGRLSGTVSIEVALPDGTVVARLGPFNIDAGRLRP